MTGAFPSVWRREVAVDSASPGRDAPLRERRDQNDGEGQAKQEMLSPLRRFYGRVPFA